jgi:enamine deaminase RidA (YjgF/YER057c/UK114 family)
MTITRLDSNGRTSQAIIDGKTIYLSGQVATNAKDVPIDAQTAEVLSIIDQLLMRCGSDKSKIVRATIYLADRGDFNGMNAAWSAWVDGNNPPARCTVQAVLLDPDWKVEIVAIATR